MPLAFPLEEYRARQAAARQALREAGLDGILLFSQPSKYWLTGYDSFGFVLFECLLFGADGSLVLLTRPTDLPAARLTSCIEEVRLWRDGAAEHPAQLLAELLNELGWQGARLGVEYETWGLTGANAKALDASCGSLCRLEDASRLIARLRLVKSEAEIACVRRAAALADSALEAAAALARPGAWEGEILAAAQGRVLAAGGDYPGNEFTIASGPMVFLPRYHSGRRRLDDVDRLVLQLGGVWRHYHAVVMATLPVGQVRAEDLRLFQAMREAQLAVRAALRPGRRLSEIYELYRQTAARHGLEQACLSACGYSLGAAYHPTWMDWPWLRPGEDTAAAPGMVFYLHMVVTDHESDCIMALAETLLVTRNDSEPLTTAQDEYRALA
jgi:Xaa-Pro dipeptidase